MQVIKIVDGETADTNNDFVLPVSSYDAHPEAFIQIEITSTFTVQILGRLHPDASFVELVAAVTADTIQPITFMPEIRVTTSGGASTPSCDVYVMIGKSPRV
jgi:hypothetical protein